jgi:predicted Zn-dependent protease
MPLALLIGILCIAGPAAAADPGLDGAKKAHQLWQSGKYPEAIEAYHALENEPGEKDAKLLAAIALGKAECLESTGEPDKAFETLKKLSDEQGSKNADLLTRMADLGFARGRWEEAEASARAALKIDADHLLGRWVLGRLQESRGQMKEAVTTWKWFVDHYNARKNDYGKKADALILIGQAAERYFRASARGEDLSEQLNDVINEIYESALRADVKCWQAPWLEGRLFLSGYNEAAAARELSRALQINPQAAEVLVTMGQADLQNYKLASGRHKAEDALEINPKYTPAMVLLADLNISDERFQDALAASKRAVTENPKDEDGLARLAASYRLLVSPIEASAVEAVARSLNPQPAGFYAALGERLADRRKYHSAERAFLLSIAALPEQAAARIGLGMLYMQVGREAEARDLFIAAFAADPFNIRADNMMKVLKHMSAYTTIKTDHFSVLVDPDQDALLGKYISRFLESVHGTLTERFGFSPPGLTQIEIMKDHKWFSGRTTGLPFIPTVGACTGKVVALASPKATGKPFNWSRVLVHEVTHVITLQQTEFNIPHWYTEALAVESEATPRPQSWNKMLLERVPNRTKLLNLDSINLGFIRPEEPEQRQLAYCQAQLYAQYMLKRFGTDALIKMLSAYRRGLTTDRAITESFHVEKKDFEAGYLEFLDSVVKTIRTRVDDEPKVTFSQLEREVRAKPDDADLNARMAYEHWARRDLKEARPYADKALKLMPHHPLASYVKARLLVTIGDEDAALALLEPALDPKRPNERVVELLAELQLQAGKLDEAERLYELARKDDPYHSKWIASLARVHLRKRRNAELAKEEDARKKFEAMFLTDLAMLAANDSDDIDVRKALAEYHLQAGHFEDAAHWAMECLYIQVYDASYHVLLADAELGRKNFATARDEFQTALELKPKRPNDLKVRLAKAQAGLGRVDEAKATLDEVLKDVPDHPAAKAAKGELSKTP